MKTILWAVAVLGSVLGATSACALTAEIRTLNGSPTMVVDGVPKTPLVFFGWSRGNGPKEVALSTEWQQYHVTFVAPEDNDGRCGVHIRVGTEPGIVWLDDACFYEGDFRAGAVNEQLRASDWEANAADSDQAWTLFVKTDAGAKAQRAIDATTSHTGKQSCTITIEQCRGDAMHVHLYQSGLRVKKGQRYTFSVWLKGDRARKAEIMALHHGEPWTIYSGRDDDPFPKQVRLAAEAGVHIHSFGVDMPWPRPGEEPNFVATDRNIEEVIAADPQAMLLPRFGVGPPGWWLEAHPDDVLRYDDGTQGSVCVASEAWRTEMLEHIRRFVAHCEEKYGNHMLGYHPCEQHTGEWFYPRTWEARHCGFGPAMQRGFTAWVKQKYGPVEALRTAWANPAADFENIAIPTVEERNNAGLGLFRDPAKEQRLVDFHEYQQVAMVEPLELLATAIKEASNRTKLTVFFYGYYFEISGLPLGPQTSGHLAMARLLECPYVDIVCSPISYGDRGLGGIGAFMVPVDSVRAHGKLWLNEDDTRTFLTEADAGYGRVDTLQQSQWVHQRNFGHLLPRRLACWYMDLGGTGWMADKGLWDNVASLRGIYDEQLTQPAAWEPEVAVIIDETGPFHLACNGAIMGPLASQFRQQWYRIGAPTGIYLLSDLVAGRVPPARVYLFLSCFSLDSEQRKAVTQQTQGKTSVWFYGSGYLNEGGASADAMSELIGMKLVEAAGLSSGTVTIEQGDHAGLNAGVEGVQFGTQKPLTPTWAVEEAPDVNVIARFEGGRPAVAAVERDGSRSVYVGTVTAPAAFLRNILKTSGVQVWLDSDDLLLTDGQFLTINASQAGHKVIRFPGPRKVTSLPDKQTILDRAEQLEVDLAQGETRMYGLEAAQ